MENGKQEVDLLIHAKWIVPVVPQNKVLEAHSLVVDKGKILALLPTEECKKQYQGRDSRKLDKHVLIPGLVNAHTHASMNLLRGVGNDVPLMDWLNNHIWPLEGKFVSDAFVYDGTRLAAAESLRGGVTCLNEMYFFPDEAARAATDMGIRMVVGLIVIDFPTVWAANADEYLSKGIAVHDSLKSNSLVTTAFAPHAPYTVSDAPLKKVQTYAEELDVPIHIHVHETADEVAQSVEQHGKRPLARMDELGLLTPRLLAVHMTQLTDEEITLCAERGISVMHCPESNLKLASGFCPTAKLSKAGVNTAIGTDGVASNNDLDMIGEMRTAALLAKGVSGDASAIPAAEALAMATINGAKALGLDATIGSLEVGKAADITAVELGNLENLPVYDVIAQIVYSASRYNVSDVWVAGAARLKSRKLVACDEQELLETAAKWQVKITKR